MDNNLRIKKQYYSLYHLYLIFFFVTIAVLPAKAAKPTFQYVRLQVGTMESIIKLYNATPLHRNNFIKLVQEGAYDSLLFHRVIAGFMIQGGDPNSKNAPLGMKLGDGDREYKIQAEFQDTLYHKKGALAAARESNPEKASSAMQFYLVIGKVYSDEDLDRMEQLRLKGRKIPPSHREVYKTIGGTPFLDQEYTVFGEVVRNIGLIDSISLVPTDTNDRPLTDQLIKMTLLNRRESSQMEAELNNMPYRPGIFRRFLDLFN